MSSTAKGNTGGGVPIDMPQGASGLSTEWTAQEVFAVIVQFAGGPDPDELVKAAVSHLHEWKHKAGAWDAYRSEGGPVHKARMDFLLKEQLTTTEAGE